MVKAKAELAFTYTRLGPTFSDHAISTFSEVIPEAREPEKWLWKFGLALTRRRSTRAHPRSLLHSQDTSERLNLLSLYLEIAQNCLSKNLKAKVFPEVALLLNTGRSTPAKEELHTAAGMTPTEACEEALRLENNDNSVLCKCGRIFRYARETERSRELLEKAVSIRPSTTGYHHLALTYKALATAEKNKDKVKVPGYYRNLEKQQQQPRVTKAQAAKTHTPPRSSAQQSQEAIRPRATASPVPETKVRGSVWTGRSGRSREPSSLHRSARQASHWKTNLSKKRWNTSSKPLTTALKKMLRPSTTWRSSIKAWASWNRQQNISN